jgi:hypothetical protein
MLRWKFSFAFACAVDLEILKEAPRCHKESAEKKIGALMEHSFRISIRKEHSTPALRTSCGIGSFGQSTPF